MASNPPPPPCPGWFGGAASVCLSPARSYSGRRLEKLENFCVAVTKSGTFLHTPRFFFLTRPGPPRSDVAANGKGGIQLQLGGQRPARSSSCCRRCGSGTGHSQARTSHFPQSLPDRCVACSTSTNSILSSLTITIDSVQQERKRSLPTVSYIQQQAPTMWTQHLQWKPSRHRVKFYFHNP